MGWAVLLTLLICMAASAVSVYPGERADGISRKLCAAAFCCMAATGFWAFVGLSLIHISPIEHKDVFGITFEQGRNELVIDRALLGNIVTRNQEIPEEAMIDLMISLITLKYTQSNSVCYVKGGQAIGIGAGQQSRIHCTRLAGNKADIWWLRQHPKALALPFREDLGRANRDNAIDVYLSEPVSYTHLVGSGNRPDQRACAVCAPHPGMRAGLCRIEGLKGDFIDGRNYDYADALHADDLADYRNPARSI